MSHWVRPVGWCPPAVKPRGTSPLGRSSPDDVLPALGRVVGDTRGDDRGILALLGRHQVGVRLLEIDTDRRGVEHPVHAGHLLHDRLEDSTQGSAEVDDRLDDRIGDSLGRAGDLLAVGRREHVRGLIQRDPLVGLRIAGAPQVHAGVDAVGPRHVLDDGAAGFHANGLGAHRRCVQERVGALDIRRGAQHPAERLQGQLVALKRLQDGSEPRPNVAVERKPVVDELQPARLDPNRALGHHVLDAGLQGPNEDRMRERLSLDGRPPRRPYHVIVQQVPNAACFNGSRPCTVFIHPVVLFHVEVAAFARGLQLNADHRVAAVHEQLDERTVAGVLELGRRAVVAGFGARAFHQVAAKRAHGRPHLVADGEPKVCVYLRLLLGQPACHGRDSGDIPRPQGRLPTLLIGHGYHEVAPGMQGLERLRIRAGISGGVFPRR